MTKRIELTTTPVKVAESLNWCLVTTKEGRDFNIHIGDALTDKDANHAVRELGFNTGVTIWAWTTGTPMYIEVSEG